MLIVAASEVKAPDTWIAEIKTMGFFEFSNIYSFCLKQLEAGNFAQNLGHWLLGLNSWASLIPIMIVIVGITIYFFGKRMKPPRLKEGFST